MMHAISTVADNLRRHARRYTCLIIMILIAAVASVALGGEIPESLRERVYKWEAYAAAARRCDRELESFGARAGASDACTDYFNATEAMAAANLLGNNGEAFQRVLESFTPETPESTILELFDLSGRVEKAMRAPLKTNAHLDTILPPIQGKKRPQKRSTTPK
jgi:hypothetical protein